MMNHQIIRVPVLLIYEAPLRYRNVKKLDHWRSVTY